MKVLILGADGYLGLHVVKALEPHYELRLTDIKPIQTKHESIRVDIACPNAVMRAADGMDVIINCSVLRQDRQLAFDVSTRGCYNMMHAAAEHGIQRVINTGPHWTVAGDSYTDYDFELSPDVPPHPGTLLYALTKGLGQEICKVFTENYDIYVLCYLFLNFRDHNDDSEGTDLEPFTVSWRDAAEAFRLGLEVDLSALPSRCEIFNIFADLPHQKFSNEKTKQILGFAPEDNFERMWHKKRKI